MKPTTKCRVHSQISGPQTRPPPPPNNKNSKPLPSAELSTILNFMPGGEGFPLEVRAQVVFSSHDSYAGKRRKENEKWPSLKLFKQQAAETKEMTSKWPPRSHFGVIFLLQRPFFGHVLGAILHFFSNFQGLARRDGKPYHPGKNDCKRIP